MIHRLLVPCFLLLAPAAAAQLSEAEGIAEVKAAAKSALKTYKGELKQALDGLETALDAVDDSLAEDSSAASVVPAAGDALADWLAAADSALFLATDAIGDSIAVALEHMGVPNGGDFPATLGYGTSGLLDDSFAKLRKTAGAARAAVEKRVRKTIAKAEKISGLALTLTLQYPRALDLMAIETDDTLVGEIGAELECALAGSRLDTDGDGVVFVAGNSDDDSFDVELYLLDANGQQDHDTAGFLAGPFTFTGTMDDDGGGLDEGIFLVSVAQGTGPERGLLGIAVR